jgi:hypothetical protein
VTCDGPSGPARSEAIGTDAAGLAGACRARVVRSCSTSPMSRWYYRIRVQCGAGLAVTARPTQTCSTMPEAFILGDCQCRACPAQEPMARRWQVGASVTNGLRHWRGGGVVAAAQRRRRSSGAPTAWLRHSGLAEAAAPRRRGSEPVPEQPAAAAARRSCSGGAAPVRWPRNVGASAAELQRRSDNVIVARSAAVRWRGADVAAAQPHRNHSGAVAAPRQWHGNSVAAAQNRCGGGGVVAATAR